MSIPASELVQVNPQVIAAGGEAAVLNGIFLTQNTQMPTNTVLGFANAAAVSSFFGPASAEALQAPKYFDGYVGSNVKPSSMLFAPFNLAARAAFVQGGSLASLSLTALKALTGVLTITVDGVSKTSSSINLSAATSFSNAASIMLAAFTAPGFTITFNATASAYVFTSSTTGASSSVTYVSGSLAAPLNLTQATGAFLSQGAVADTPTTAMNTVVNKSQAFTTFVTLWEPVQADKLLFWQWSSGQNDKYLYAGWDSDVNASIQGATGTLAQQATSLNLDGGIALSGDPALAAAKNTTLAVLALDLATWLAGAVASIDFSQRNGRRTLAYMRSSLIAATCSDLQISRNLRANGYNFYGDYATSTQEFVNFQNGQLPGQWKWGDSYINQINLNAELQLSLLQLASEVGSIPYNAAGYGLIRSTCADPITNALNFGTIRTGVQLSQSQIAQVNQDAGVNAAASIQTQGYYLQILDPGADVRIQRGSPVINLWYADGGSIQKIVVNSTDVL